MIAHPVLVPPIVKSLALNPVTDSWYETEYVNDVAFDGDEIDGVIVGVGTFRYVMVASPFPVLPVMLPPAGFGMLAFPATSDVFVIQ